MADKRTGKDPLGAPEAKFTKALAGWSDLAAKNLEAQGAGDLLGVVAKLKQALLVFARNFWEKLKALIANLDPVGAAGAIGQIVGSGIEDLLDGLNDLIEDLLNTAGAATDAAVGAVLGLIEVVKKLLHLILDGLKVPDHIRKPIEVFLDLIDNVLGNIAELVSSITGKTAKTLRTNMYQQLAQIRTAEAARGGRYRGEDVRDDD